jgi:thymidylate synthase
MLTRMFSDFPEAMNEITRDLAELGRDVHTETMQDKDIKDDPAFATKELTNYMYTVLRPNYSEIEGVHEEWVKTEWEDRLRGELNPGRAWRTRPEVWEQFLEIDKGAGDSKLPRVFAYTYSQRMGGTHIERVVEELIRHPNSRQLYLPVWKADPDERRRGERRVPCSLGYWFVKRDAALHETYMMRSCDFFTHYPNDVALATILLHYIAMRAGLKVGTFTHFVGSFHVYARDVKHVF